MTDRGVECAAAFFCHHQRKSHGFKEDGTGRHRHAGMRSELPQLAALVEPCAPLLNLVKPSKRPLDSGFCARTDDMNLHKRPHYDFSPDGAHFAFASASTTA